MSNEKVQGNRLKVKSKTEINKPVVYEDDFSGSALKIPNHIQAELDEAGLVPRFVSVKKVADSGGYHPKGWTPYTIKNPTENPLTGQMDKTFRVGDLILAVKTKQAHNAHLAELRRKSDAQSASHKNSVKEMRDRIKDSGADKHVSLIEGYEENESDE